MELVGPRKISLTDIGITTLGGLISGFIGSIIILLIVVVSSKLINIPSTFESARLAGGTTNPFFPFILSCITFIATLFTQLINTKLLSMIDGEKYKSNIEIYGQIGIFSIILYLCFTPIYMYLGIQSYDNIFIIFIVHVLLFSFGSSLILELLNNYRYILIGFYGNFIALCLSSSIILLLFYSLSTGRAKLIIMLIIIPLTLTLMTLLRGLFEMIYFLYYRLTNLDGIGDIFYRIESEEKEKLKLEQEKNSI